MNSPVWSLTYGQYCQQASPSNFYPYTQCMSSPPPLPNMMSNTLIQTSLNSSSGYESAVNEVSIVDHCHSAPSFTMKETSGQIYENITDEDSGDNISVTQHERARKKRRVLSTFQREEANRRERQRMEIINEAYERLRNCLPFKKGRKRQKMSRMDTVDGAIRYIHILLETLHGPNYNPNWAQ